MEDAFGNVYEVSNPAFVTVVNYTDKNPNDKNPFAVNSSDYGWPIPPSNTDQKLQALEKTMAQDQIENAKNNKLPFVSNLVVKNNSDATFNQ